MVTLTRIVTKSVNLELLSEDLNAALPILQSITINGFDRPTRLPNGEHGAEHTLAAEAKETSSKTVKGVKEVHISPPGEIVFEFERDFEGVENATFNGVLTDHVSSLRTSGQQASAQRVLDVAELRGILRDGTNLTQPNLKKMLSVLLSKH